MGQPIEETVGQLMNTDTSWITSVKRRGFTRFVLYFGRLLFVLQEKSAQKKPCSFSVSSLTAWDARLWIAQICGCVGEASFCGRLQFKNKTKNKQAQQIETKGGAEEFGDPTKLPL